MFSKPKEIYEDYSFLGLFVDDESARVESNEDFDIAETCQRIRDRDEEAATKLLLAIHLERFDGKKLNPKTRDQIFEAFLFIVSHPGTFDHEFRGYTKKLYSRLKFSQKQLDRLHELEGGVSWRDRRRRYSDIDEEYCGFKFGYESSNYSDSEYY